MKQIRLFTTILLTAFSCCGCSSTKKIQENMNASSYSISYALESTPIVEKNSITVNIEPILFDPVLLNDTTIVLKEKGWIAPLLFINVWRYQRTCTMGAGIILESIPVFLQTQLESAIVQSANFNLSSGDTPDYSVEVTIDEIRTEGPYVSAGIFYMIIFAWGYIHNDKAGPAISTISVSYQLKQEGQVIHSNTFKSETVGDPWDKYHRNTTDLQKDYAENMVNTTSKSFMSIIDLLVKDLNGFLTSDQTYLQE